MDQISYTLATYQKDIALRSPNLACNERQYLTPILTHVLSLRSIQRKFGSLAGMHGLNPI